MVLKTMVQNWFKRHETMENKVDTMVIQLTRVEERVSTLQRTEERTREQDRILAVIQNQLSEFRESLNGIGRKVREMQPG